MSVDGVADAVKLRTIMTEIIAGQGEMVQGLGDHAVVQAFEKEERSKKFIRAMGLMKDEGILHGIFFDGFLLGGATTMSLFLENHLKLGDIRARMLTRF